MDVVRTILGERKISYLGLSYGTALGAVYTQMFPTRADRFVLDSAVDPKRMWRGMIQVWGSETEPAFQRWAAWTAERSATHHLGETPYEVAETFRNLVDRADRDPAGCPSGRAVRAGQWRPWALSDAPPKSRATARKGRVTTVAMALPTLRKTSAIALNISGTSDLSAADNRWPPRTAP